MREKTSKRKKNKKRNIIIRGKCGGSNAEMSVTQDFLDWILKEQEEEEIVKRRKNGY